MTREVAIKAIQDFIGWFKKDSDIYEALEMAIQALSQEPCDDAISRQVAIDTIESWLSCDDYNETERHIMRAMQSVLYDLPSVTQICDDAISRDAVNTLVDELARAISDERCFIPQRGRSTATIMQDILDLPPVTQKSETVTEFADRCRECGKMRKGHWIYDETIENWRCSKCNETPKTMGYVGTADFMAEHFKFCNHCGAKMESEE